MGGRNEGWMDGLARMMIALASLRSYGIFLPCVCGKWWAGECVCKDADIDSMRLVWGKKTP